MNKDAGKERGEGEESKAKAPRLTPNVSVTGDRGSSNKSEFTMLTA